MGCMIVMGVLAAFGFICVLWALAGWLLPGGLGSAAVCLCHPGLKELSAVRRLCWLRDVGLYRGAIFLVDCGISETEQKYLTQIGHGVEICSLEELSFRLEKERKRLD